MKKHLKILMLLLIASLILVGCSTESPAEEPNEEELLELTLEELAQYDGKEGRKAYVAVDGVIYDFTDSDMWGEGEHNGFEAGKDLTDGIKESSPHGLAVLERMPIVGNLVED